MWSETFTDSFGNRWTVRRAEEWETVQLLVTGPDFEGEPFSYGLRSSDYSALLELLERGRANELELPRRQVYAVHLWRDETKAEYCGSWHVPVTDEDAGRIAELRRAGFGLASLEDGSRVRAFFHEDELAAQVLRARASLEVWAEPERVHYRAGMDKRGELVERIARRPFGSEDETERPFSCRPDESAGLAELRRELEELRAGRDPRD